MWKSPKPDERPTANTSVPVTNPPEIKKEFRPMEPVKSADSFRADVAHIGKSVLVKGELSGSEDLYLDGEVEGSIDLQEHNLTIGPHGRVRANVKAKDVIVHGKVDGNIQGTDRVELKRSAVLVGDISTQRIVIEDGAFFKGAIDIKKEAKPAVKAEAPKTFAAAASFNDQPTFTPQS
ncbi:MAG TPA: polymer-forming cytoskeletal protein [Terriglobales bacterium]|nr:polymer-forming cytoskeletal protein [Terriglobales bacterium]